MLKIQDLKVSYGGIQALRGIDLEVPDGKIVTLIGANGAGKSTTLRTISGLVKAESGSIQWNGEELLGKPIDKIISAGIAMSPEGRRVFADLTVLENLKLGAYLRKDKAEIEKDLKWVYQLFPRLEERNWQVDVVFSHTCPLKYEPVEVFLPGIDQSTVDKSTEEWLDTIESKLHYERWYCGHYHTEKQVDKLRFMFEDYALLPHTLSVEEEKALIAKMERQAEMMEALGWDEEDI